MTQTIKQFNSIPAQSFWLQTPFNNLKSHAREISDLETEQTKAIIRESLIKEGSGLVPRNKDTFASASRQLCMIDIDSLAWEGAFDDQQALVAHTVQYVSTIRICNDAFYRLATLFLHLQSWHQFR